MHKHAGARARLTGALDVQALTMSFDELLRRHEGLRATFTGEDEPQVAIAPVQAFHLPVLDLSALPVEQREADVAQLADEDVRLPFDLSRAHWSAQGW